MIQGFALSIALGLGLLNLGFVQLVSVEDEIKIGREAQDEVKRQVPELGDRAVTNYVREIGRRLTAHAPGPKYPYSFSVADYREINAFALPGGPVWVHRGALGAARTEAQFAGVVAHEVAHIAQRHAADQLTKAMVANGLLGLLGAVLGNDGSGRAANIAAGLFAEGLFLKFGRDGEREADRVGAQIMQRAGWDPRGMVEFLQVLREKQGRDPSGVEIFLSTHPSPGGRSDELEAEVRRLGSGRRDTNEFQQIRRRLDHLPPPKSMPRR